MNQTPNPLTVATDGEARINPNIPSQLQQGEAFRYKNLGLSHKLSPECFAPTPPFLYSKHFSAYYEPLAFSP